MTKKTPQFNWTPKRERFCVEYLIDLNAAHAAERSGFSKKTSAQIGHELLGFPEIQKRITKGRDRLMAKTELTAERVVLEMRRLAFSDIRDAVSWGPKGLVLDPSANLSDGMAAAVHAVKETTSQTGSTIEIKLHPKTPALEMLGKYFRLFIDTKVVLTKRIEDMTEDELIDLLGEEFAGDLAGNGAQESG